MNTSRIKSFVQNLNALQLGWSIFLISTIFSGVFIILGVVNSGAGYPLDDSWIHQTYARNLVLTGKWEFIIGQPSAGSTSPLWTFLISIGYLFSDKIAFIWTSLLSASLLGGSSLILFITLAKLYPNQKWICFGCSFIFSLDWHLLWSSGSGMETLLFIFLFQIVFYLLLSNNNWLWIGFISGLIIWVRPDGATLLGPVLLPFAIKIRRKEVNLIDIFKMLFPIILAIGLYGWFNQSLAETYFPNTYFAKQLEYASELSAPLIKRLWKVFLVPISGAGVLLIPTFIYSMVKKARIANIWYISLVLWFFGYGVIYALKLPMVYQHGRYLFPLWPAFSIISFIGILEISEGYVKKTIAIKFLMGVLVAISMVFSYFGLQAFRQDLKTIDQLMIKPALWIKLNTPSESLIAVHDIGAMGYFSERSLIDLAGLVQPEVIPIIRNEEKLKQLILENETDYLVVFKDWYEQLGEIGDEVNQFEYQGETIIVNRIAP